jgi:ribosomal protein L40E
MARKRKPEDDLAAASANPPQHIPAGPKIDFFRLMPGYPKRHDGWNQQRVQRFLDVLAHTGCVKDAARVAGMSAVAARRAQRRFPLFAAAWEDALDRSRQGLIAIAYQRAVEGRETIIIRKGEEYERKIEPSDSMLGLLIKRGDMSGGRLGEKAEDILTFDEYKAGWRFTGFGKKYKQDDPAVVRARLDAKFALMRKRMFADADAKGVCLRCDAPLPPGVTNAALDGHST